MLLLVVWGVIFMLHRQVCVLTARSINAFQSVCPAHCLFASSPFQTSKNQIKVDLVDENFTELKGEIAGPPDTPYEGERPLETSRRPLALLASLCNFILHQASQNITSLQSSPVWSIKHPDYYYAHHVWTTRPRKAKKKKKNCSKTILLNSTCTQIHI